MTGIQYLESTAWDCLNSFTSGETWLVNHFAMVSVLDLGEGALSPQLIFTSWTEAHKAQPCPQDARHRDEVEQRQEKT